MVGGLLKTPCPYSVGKGERRRGHGNEKKGGGKSAVIPPPLIRAFKSLFPPLLSDRHIHTDAPRSTQCPSCQQQSKAESITPNPCQRHDDSCFVLKALCDHFWILGGRDGAAHGRHTCLAASVFGFLFSPFPFL